MNVGDVNGSCEGGQLVATADDKELLWGGPTPRAAPKGHAMETGSELAPPREPAGVQRSPRGAKAFSEQVRPGLRLNFQYLFLVGFVCLFVFELELF